MESVALGRTGLTTSALGYGCSGLLRPPTDRERTALLAAAFDDAGIRHFDIARYYGHGGAEAVLGGFLRDAGRRDAVTITTKFGIEPPAVGGGGKRGAWIMRLARRVAALHPTVHRALGRAANRGVRAGRFDPESARRSLETSLRELQTDRVDLLLLHEATLADTRTEGLAAFLEAARQQGKIRAWGVGSDFAQIPEVVAHALGFAEVVQFADAVDRPNLRRLPPDPARAVLTHGALQPLRALAPAAARPENRAAFDRWLDAAGLDRATPLARLLLARARHENPGGVTLFSSLAPDHVRANAAALESFPGADAWAEFERLAAGWLRPTDHAA